MANATITRAPKTKCRRCGGFMVGEVDALSCLLCGHQEYGANFQPFTKKEPESARLEQGPRHREDPDEVWGARLADLVHPLGERLIGSSRRRW